MPVAVMCSAGRRHVQQLDNVRRVRMTARLDNGRIGLLHNGRTGLDNGGTSLDNNAAATAVIASTTVTSVVRPT